MIEMSVMEKSEKD